MLTLTRAIAYTWTALPTLLIRLAQAVPTSHPLYKRDGLLPSSYIQPKLHRSRDSISKLSQGSIQYMIDHTPAVDDGNIFYWQYMNAWTAVINWDKQGGTNVYQGAVKGALGKLGGNFVINAGNDDTLWSAQALVRAYRAYGDGSYLDQAVALYNGVRDVSRIKPDAGKTCNQKSVAGGVYWQSNWASGNKYVNTITTALFAMLAADLCDVTGNKDYCTAAQKSLTFLDNHMVSSNGLLYDGVTLKSDTECDYGANKESQYFSYNVGQYQSAYAKLSSITGDGAAKQKAVAAAEAAMITQIWNNDKGIINEVLGSTSRATFKGVLVRQLTLTAALNIDGALTAAINQYVRIQYYGVTQLASDSKDKPMAFRHMWDGSNSIIGPGPDERSQGPALDVLAAVRCLPDASFGQDEAGPVATI